MPVLFVLALHGVCYLAGYYGVDGGPKHIRVAYRLESITSRYQGKVTFLSI